MEILIIFNRIMKFGFFIVATVDHDCCYTDNMDNGMKIIDKLFD
jgi:hypothetical protein